MPPSIPDAPPGPADARAGGAPPWLWAAGLIVAATAAVLVAGLTSEIVRGDEGYHIQFARAWYEGGLPGRPTHNPHYPSGDPPGYSFVTEPLWPLGLSLLWHLTGPVNWAAQAYQAACYALLLAVVYGMGRHLLGPQGGLAALLLAVSVPMFGAFSVLLYTDVPAAAVIGLAALLVLRKHHVAAGVVLGLAFLTKRHTLLVAPGLVFWILMEEGTWRQRVGRVAMLLVPSLVVVLPDFVWRRIHLSSGHDPANAHYILDRLRMLYSNVRMPSNLNNPRDLVVYLGALVPAAAVLYLVRRAWARGHGRMWLAAGLFMVGLVIFFTLDTDVRYTMPAVPLVVVTVAAGLKGWWRRGWVLALVGLAAFGHLGAAAWVVHGERHLTPGQRAVFRYLREQTPPDTLVMYPGEVVLTQADRPVVWAQLVDPDTGTKNAALVIAGFSTEKVRRVLWANGVDYVCVDEETVCEPDASGRRLGGYDRSFVERLPTFPFLERVPGDWPGIILYRVRPEGAGGEPAGAPPS